MAEKTILNDMGLAHYYVYIHTKKETILVYQLKMLRPWCVGTLLKKTILSGLSPYSGLSDLS